MPKALCKTKHGCKASVTEQSLTLGHHPGMSAPQLASKGLPRAVTKAHSHAKPHKGASLSSKVERHRDKVLTQLCSKAADCVRVSAPPTEDTVQTPPSGAGCQAPVTSDQMSLKDCSISIPTEGLWGTKASIKPSLVSTVIPEQRADPFPSQSLPLHQMGPEQLKQLIAEAIQRSLPDRLPPASAAPSVVAGPLVTPDTVAQDDDCLSLMAPDSPP